MLENVAKGTGEWGRVQKSKEGIRRVVKKWRMCGTEQECKEEYGRVGKGSGV